MGSRVEPAAAPALPPGTQPALALDNAEASATASAGSSAAPSRRLLLTADTQTSSIIAIGEPRLLEQVEALLKTLDVRQPQVVLDVTIVSLTEGQSRDLGVELEKIDMYGNTLVRLSSLFGLSSRAGDTRAVGDAIGFTGVVLSPGDFSVVIRALETVNQGRNLSLPRILVDNNQQATLDAVREEPFLSVNASDTIATTSFGGSASAGTQISLRPQIAEGDHLLLEYSISLSSFVGESSAPSLPPPRQDSSISSIATIPDGHAIVLGGLETQNEGDAESRLPVLGTIPLVGELFKNRSRSNSRTRFYVFIRASVMRGEGFEYLKYISARSMEELGMDDGWPVVEPRIIR
jgi:general secretion pathway protein D